MHDLTSDGKLPQMIIKMLMLQHAPAVPRNTPEHAAGWPRRGRSAGRKARNQIPQTPNVGRPGRRTCGEKFGWALPLPFRPRQDMNHQPIQRKPSQWTRGRTRFELPKTLSQPTTHMTHHFVGREASPNGFAVGGEAPEAIEDRGSDVGIKE